jgi:hypothetical protein
MLSLVSYYNLMIAFFTYSGFGSQLLIIVFIPMIYIMSYRRFGLFMITLGVMIDIMITSLGSYVSSNVLKYVENYSSPASSGSDFILYQLYGFPTLLMYVIMRIGISAIEAVRDLWGKGSELTRAFYIIQLLFPGAVGLLLLIHAVVFVAWLVKTLFSLL